MSEPPNQDDLKNLSASTSNLNRFVNRVAQAMNRLAQAIWRRRYASFFTVALFTIGIGTMPYLAAEFKVSLERMLFVSTAVIISMAVLFLAILLSQTRVALTLHIRDLKSDNLRLKNSLMDSNSTLEENKQKLEDFQKAFHHLSDRVEKTTAGLYSSINSFSEISGKQHHRVAQPLSM